jgi:hypothetical protein
VEQKAHYLAIGLPFPIASWPRFLPKLGEEGR